jgi:Holliday junction resolvase-like predicted endonuclease
MRAAGDDFEQRACTALERAGLTLLARNYTTRHGELDLVMRDGDTIVFVEKCATAKAPATAAPPPRSPPPSKRN